MADADQQVTAWDEHGNPIKAPTAGASAPMAWDEHGNPVGDSPKTTEAQAPTRAPGEARQLSQKEVDTFQPKTQFEKNIPGHGITTEGAGTAAWEGVKGLGKGLLGMVDPTTGLSGAGLSAVHLNPRSGTATDHLKEIPIVRAAHEIKAAQNDPTASAMEVPLAGAGSLVGESAESARGHAARGEGGAILGEAAVPVAATLGGAALGEALPRVRAGLRDAAFKELPTNGPQLTKGANRVARAGGTLAGGGLGAATGIPGAGYAGGVAGFELGPTLMEKVLGTPELGDVRNPGPFSKIPMRTKIAPPPEPPLGSPENPGWHSDIPKRMPKPALLAQPFESPTEQPLGASLPDTGEFYEHRGTDLMKRGAQQAAVDRAAKPAPQGIVSPSTGIGEPRMTGSEGRAATWTNERVMELAGKGNREAIQQAVRRGMELPPGARYVMGDPDFGRTVYNPRESTTFTPEGEPIRNLETPEKSSRARIALPEEGTTPKEIISATTGEVTRPRVALPEGVSATPPGEAPPIKQAYSPSEKVKTLASPRRSLGPEFESQQREEMIQRYKDILRNPKATAEDAAEANARLRELGALKAGER